MKTMGDLRNQFKEETGTNWENSQHEPDIDYVDWLEKKIIEKGIFASQPKDEPKAKEYSSKVIQTVIDSISEEDKQRSCEKLSSMKSETVLRKVSVKERLPEKDGTYNTDRGYAEFIERSGDFEDVNQDHLYVEWWLEEVSMKEDAIGFAKWIIYDYQHRGILTDEKAKEMYREYTDQKLSTHK